MEAKHTKGEWIIEERTHGFYVCSGYKGFVIADVTGDEITHFIGNTDEAKANAKLIASAPEMLKELQHIVERINTVRPNDAFCQALRDRANEVIAKATE